MSGRHFNEIRRIRRKRGEKSTIESWSLDEHRSLIANAKGESTIGAAAASAKLDLLLQPEMAEVFFAGRPVLVEGTEDRAIITALLEKADLFEEFISKSGHIIPVDGKEI